MGKSHAFFAAIAAAGFGFFVLPAFGEDRNGLAPPSIPTMFATPTPAAAPSPKVERLTAELNKTRGSASAELVEASDPLVNAPNTFATGGSFNDWLVKLLKKVYPDLTGKPLPEGCDTDFAKAFKELRKENKGHEGGCGPRGSLVFYPDHLAYSNGEGTVIVAEGAGAPSPRVAAGSPLGWAEATAGPGAGASGGGATATGGGTGGGTTTTGGGAGVAGGPAAPLPEIDLKNLPDAVKKMVEKANWITQQRYPYLWGGGHNASFSGPYDCSGSVSAVLHAGGVLDSCLVAQNFMNWGAPGPGVVSIYASPTHVYMAINGKFFGTSSSNPGGGAAWFDGSPRPGFVVRHVPINGK